MNREALLELAYQRTELDGDVLDLLTDDQLGELLGSNSNKPEESVDLVKPLDQTPKPKLQTLNRISFEYVESKSGKLVRRENYSNGSVVYVRCGERVQFNGRTVSASIVLHWVRTGELVARAPRPVKAFRAVVREGAKVKHLGRFATREERDAAVFAFRLGFVPSK